MLHDRPIEEYTHDQTVVRLLSLTYLSFVAGSSITRSVRNDDSQSASQDPLVIRLVRSPSGYPAYHSVGDDGRRSSRDTVITTSAVSQDHVLRKRGSSTENALDNIEVIILSFFFFFYIIGNYD